MSSETYSLQLVEWAQADSLLAFAVSINGPANGFPALLGASLRSRRAGIVDLSPQAIETSGRIVCLVEHPQLIGDFERPAILRSTGEITFALWSDDSYTSELARIPWTTWDYSDTVPLGPGARVDPNTAAYLDDDFSRMRARHAGVPFWTARRLEDRRADSDVGMKSVGVLFDIDELGGPSSYGPPCWRILMKHLDLREMPGLMFYQGDVEIEASGRPYCYCIAVSELQDLSGGRGVKHFMERLSRATDAGLFPQRQRFMRGEITRSLIPSGRVDVRGRFRMSSQLGGLGDMRLVRNGRELGWTVLPDDDSLADFAMTYLAMTGGEGLPLDDQSRELCETVLREMGQSSTIAALRRAGLPVQQLTSSCDRILRQVWSDERRNALDTRRWWDFWK